VETLVAILILSFAIIPVMFIASQGAGSANQSRNQMIASYLAQDAMDLIIAKKTENIIACKTANHTCITSNDRVGEDWLAGFQRNCVNGKRCNIFTDDTAVSTSFNSQCGSSSSTNPSGCSPLLYNKSTGMYTYTATAGQTSATTFYRSATLTKITNIPNGDGAAVEVKVYWRGAGISKNNTLTLRTNIFNFKP
jgi:hypothetical protein